MTHLTVTDPVGSGDGDDIEYEGDSAHQRESNGGNSPTDNSKPDESTAADDSSPETPAEKPSESAPEPDGSDESGLGSGGSGGGDPRDSITQGSLLWPLFRLTWPILVIQLLQVTYNVVDTLYLGRLSAEAVGALSLAFPLIFLLIAVAGGFTTAGAILVAQYTGAKGDRSAGLVAGQTITTVSAFSVLIGIGGYFYTRPALELLPSDAETAATVIPLAADYMEVIFLGIPLMFGFFVFSALLRGYGDTRTPMFVMVVSVFVNVVLDPFLIFGFTNNPIFVWFEAAPLLGAIDFVGMEATALAATGFTGFGIQGAALATIIARGVATAIGLWLLFNTAVGPAIRLQHLSPDFEFITDIFRLGLPSSVEQTTSALAMITLTAMVVTFSPPVVAAYGLGNRLISLVFLPAMGLGRAIDTMVGQNLGADRSDRALQAVKIAASTGAGVMLVVAVIAVVFTEPIVSVFLGDVPRAAETIRHGVEYVRIRTVEFAFIGVSQVVLGAFRGAGNTKTAMSISVISLWLGRVATVFYLVFVAGWGATGIWVGMAVGHIVSAVLGVGWFSRGTWTEKYIDEADMIEPPASVDE